MQATNDFVWDLLGTELRAQIERTLARQLDLMVGTGLVRRTDASSLVGTLAHARTDATGAFYASTPTYASGTRLVRVWHDVRGWHVSVRDGMSASRHEILDSFPRVVTRLAGLGISPDFGWRPMADLPREEHASDYAGKIAKGASGNGS